MNKEADKEQMKNAARSILMKRAINQAACEAIVHHRVEIVERAAALLAEHGIAITEEEKGDLNNFATGQIE